MRNLGQSKHRRARSAIKGGYGGIPPHPEKFDSDCQHVKKIHVSRFFDMGGCFSAEKNQKKKIVLKKPLSLSSEKETLDKLEKESFDDLKKFSFNGLSINAKVISVYDGDTLDLVFYHRGVADRHAFRMLGYDSPEMKPKKDCPHHDLHVQAGTVARDTLKKKVMGKIVQVKFCKEEKYGRLMGDIYLGDLHINQWMIQQGYGKIYDGGQKSEFTEKELSKIVGGG